MRPLRWDLGWSPKSSLSGKGSRVHPVCATQVLEKEKKRRKQAEDDSETEKEEDEESQPKEERRTRR